MDGRGVAHICIPKDIQEWQVIDKHRSNANVAHHSGDWSAPSTAKPARRSLQQGRRQLINDGSKVDDLRGPRRSGLPRRS